MTEPLIHLHNKTAIITGASRGIGEAIAIAFADAGAQVVLASRKIEGLEAVAETIKARGGKVAVCACHTGRRADIERLFGYATSVFGPVSVLVNNAATNPYFGPMLSVDEAAWRKTFEVNLEGYFHASRELASRAIAERREAAIVNIASVVALGAAPLQGVYAMTKAAVVSMTETLAYELGPERVRVNAVAPGLIRTKFSSALVDNDAIRERIVSKTPLGRVGEPSDIAGAALFLASDAARFVTGHTLVVDGGMTLAAI